MFAVDASDELQPIEICTEFKRPFGQITDAKQLPNAMFLDGVKEIM